MLSFTLCLALVVFACWLTATVRQRRELHAKQQEAWEGIVDEAAAYDSSLGCPMALVSAADFLDFRSFVHFESIRDQGKLRCLDTLEKVGDFRKTFLTVNLSHKWLAPTSPDVNGVLYRIMCAAVRRAINAANLTSDLVFLWVDYCSIPQEYWATRELHLASALQYVFLCDLFIIVAPPKVHDLTDTDLSTHFVV